MRSRLVLSAILLAAAAANAQTSTTSSRLIGRWSGVLIVGPNRLRLALVLRDSGGALAGEMISVDQGNAEMKGAVGVHGDSLTLTIPDPGIIYRAALTSGSDTLRGTFAQSGHLFPLDFVRGGDSVRVRPQQPRPPYPYRTQDVTVASTGGVQLACTLLIPDGRGPFPGVVFVTGSGPQDRDETLFDHQPFLVIADHLGRQSIASLRCDDRGAGKSSGSFGKATSADFADDAEAMVRYLAGVSGVARDRVGIIGHSEGGLIAPMVAARDRAVAFIVLIAGPGVPGDSVSMLQTRRLLPALGVPAQQAQSVIAINRALYTAVKDARDSADAAARLAAGRASLIEGAPEALRPAVAQRIDQATPQLLSPWMRFFLAYDPRPALRAVKVPVLAIDGTLDLQVSASENLAAIDSALTVGGNRDHRVVELPGLNHLMQTAKTGAPNEYATIDETISPAVLELIASWIGQRFGQR